MVVQSSGVAASVWITRRIANDVAQAASIAIHGPTRRSASISRCSSSVIVAEMQPCTTPARSAAGAPCIRFANTAQAPMPKNANAMCAKRFEKIAGRVTGPRAGFGYFQTKGAGVASPRPAVAREVKEDRRREHDRIEPVDEPGPVTLDNG